MSNVLFSVASILRETKQNKRYRVISIFQNNAVLCEMDISSFNLMLMSIPAIMTMLSDGSLEIEKEEPVVFDIENYSEAVQDTYHKRLSMINEINLAYGPNYIELIDRKHRAKYNEIRLKYGMPRNTFNRICTYYFQSGMNNYALLDKRALGEKKQNAYHYVAKPGKKASAGVSSGVVLTDEVRSYFEEALREYKSGRQKTIRSAFDRMNNLYFTRVEMINKLIEEVHPHYMSIPGIGPLSAAVIYSEYSDISNFSNPGQMLAFAGIEPGINESGTESHGGRMVKRGSSQLRYTLINCCLPLIRFDMTFATYYAKKRGEGKPHRVAITHVAKKLIRVIYALERQDIDFNTQKLH